MKEPTLTEVIDEIVKEDIETLNELIKEEVVPLYKQRHKVEQEIFNKAYKELKDLEGEG